MAFIILPKTNCWILTFFCAIDEVAMLSLSTDSVGNRARGSVTVLAIFVALIIMISVEVLRSKANVLS